MLFFFCFCFFLFKCFKVSPCWRSLYLSLLCDKDISRERKLRTVADRFPTTGRVSCSRWMKKGMETRTLHTSNSNRLPDTYIILSLFLSLFLPPSFSSSVWSSDRIKQWGLNPGQLRWLCVASDDTCLDSPPLHARWVAGWRSPLRRRWNRLPALSALKCSLTSHHPDVEKARQPLSFSFCYTLRSPEGNKTNKQTKKRYLPSGVFVWFRPAFGSRLLFAL